MENKINVAELLKDCPKGMELDCLLCNSPIALEGVAVNESKYPIKAVCKDGFIHVLTKYGTLYNHDDAKCVIFPKGKTTWEGFVPPCKFKDGDILFLESIYNWIFIYKESENKKNLYKYVAVLNEPNNNYIACDNTPLCYIKDVSKIRFATEEEKQKLFNEIKDNGYHWNAETKTLEKLVKLKFKVGDRIKKGEKIATIVRIVGNYYDVIHDSGIGSFTIDLQDEWELVPNKFDINTLKPFESRVLVRDSDCGEWRGALWGYLREKRCMKYDTSRGVYRQCIPYENNEYLLGKIDDCDEFYKTWK